MQGHTTKGLNPGSTTYKVSDPGEVNLPLSPSTSSSVEQEKYVD